jgi:hypothetical protein
MAQARQMFTVRLSRPERDAIKALARQLERNESDALRYVLRSAAREAGISIDREPLGSECRDDHAAPNGGHIASG